MNNGDNVKEGYICTLCNAHSFQDEFRDKHNSMGLTGLDLKTGDVFLDPKPTLNDSPYAVILIRRETRPTTSHERQYLTERYEVTVGKSIRIPNICLSTQSLPSSYLKDGQLARISDEQLRQFVELFMEYGNPEEVKSVQDAGGLRIGTLNQ